VRGTPWLGSRRGVVITSRSDRVPLLSRRHTLAEKQNGTSDRPTDRATDPSPFSLLSPFLSPHRPCLFLSFSSLSPRDFYLDEIFSRNCQRAARRAPRAESNARNVAVRIIRVIDMRKSREERKKKRPPSLPPSLPTRWGRRKNCAGRVGEWSTHLFQSSRGTRDSIREINDRRIGTILCRAPSGYETKPRFLSFRFEERRTRKGDPVLASGPQKRLGVPLIYERDPASILVYLWDKIDRRIINDT
jgi:hypothetical protein